MPEAKSKARLRISESGLNLCDQPPPKGVEKSSSMYMRIDNKQAPPCGDQGNQRESPLNLVMNTKYSNQNLGMKCSPVPVSAPNKTTPPSTEFNSNDISSPESMTVPKNPVNKLNYFPKSVSNFQDLGPPVPPGHFWQRIGPYHYNSNTSGAPLVAFVNPTATSVIPHGLKPDFSAPNTIPNVDSMNPIVYTPMPSSKSNLNLNQHLPAPMILVRSSLPLSKPGNFQYVMNPTEKGASSSSSISNNNNNNNKSSSSSSSFSKSSPQAIFGNESGKFIPVATIVPNNASLVTNSQKTVTSILPGESILSTNQFKSSDFERRKSMPDSSSIKSKSKCPNSNSALWYSTLNGNRNPPMNLQPSSSSMDYLLNTKAKPHYFVSQPLNLTLQSASDFSNRSSPQNPDTTGKQKNFTMLPPSSSSSQSPEMRFRPTNTNPSSVLFNYSFPNQNVYMPNPAHLNKGLLSRLPFENKMAALNSKVHSRASYGHSINLSEGSRHFSSLRLPTQSAEKSESASPNDDEPPMTLRIDSIFSLAEKPATETAEQTKQKTKPSPKTKTKAPNKLVCKDKNIIKKAGVSSSKSCNRRSPKDRKRPVKKLPKSTNQRSNNSLEIKNSVLSRKTLTQNHDITVSCHANDFKALHPMTEEERKLNTFFRYLGLRPSSSLNSGKSCNGNGANVGQGNSTDDCGNVSKELARCFNCYVVVPMFQASEDFVSLDVGNPPASFKTMENCSKACRHEFLIQQHATSTGIVTRSAEFDSSWKIVSQSPNCPHTRKKYCRKSKTKASGNFTGSHCRRFGCIGCSTRRPTASPTTTNSSSSHNKMKYFRKNAKEEPASKLLSTNKDSSNMAASPHSKEVKKKSYALNKKTNSDKNYSTEKSVKDSMETDSKCHNVLVEKNNSAFRKRKTSQDCHGNNKVSKKDINEVENVINNSLDILEAESVDEVSPLVSNFLDIEDPCHTESRLLPVKKTGVSPETVFLPANDTSASSERIQRLKEILKEKQKDLEIARQLLL